MTKEQASAVIAVKVLREAIESGDKDKIQDALTHTCGYPNLYEEATKTILEFVEESEEKFKEKE